MTTAQNKKRKILIDEKFLPPDTNLIIQQRNILTIAYWEVSRSWNDAPNAKPMNVGDALTLLQPLSSDDSLPKLSRLSTALKDKIIAFGTKRQAKKEGANLNGPNNLGTRIYVI